MIFIERVSRDLLVETRWTYLSIRVASISFAGKKAVNASLEMLGHGKLRGACIAVRNGLDDSLMLGDHAL
jgi:hypothetical protein